MNTQKIILSILGLVIVIGLGFVAIKSNNKIIEQGNIGKPIETPVPPITTPTKPTENPSNSPTEFGKLITFKLNDQITFSDGLVVVLKEINDSRCPAGVECFWAGELSGNFSLSGAKLTAIKEIRLGTINNKSVSLEGYIFSLKDATKNSLTIEVIKN